jgi:biopolymer transport protein ExbB
MFSGNVSIIDFFLASPPMMVLLLCSIITVGYAIERTLYFKTTSINAKRFMRELLERLRAGNRNSALEFCRGKKAALARVMEQAVGHLHMGAGDLRERVATAIEVEQVEMERNLGVLGTMSNIAPLLGLFGTVIGIIRAFADIARTGSGGSSVVAMGVSEALMTTAAGIVIAVIATVFFNAFARKIRTRIVEMEDARSDLFALLSERKAARERQEARPRRAAVAGAPSGHVEAGPAQVLELEQRAR